ncbi:MAG: hypothetical protein IH586_15805, partial [Anaerolineaceae bacterium]|nr:hypothetical protein [Anaerolineaceae bacterium]
FEEDVLARQPFSVRFETPIYTAWLEYGAEPMIRSGEPLQLNLHFENMLRKPQWLTVRWHLPEGWQITPAAQVNLVLPHYIGGHVGIATAEFNVTPGELSAARSDLFADITSDGHHTRLVIPVTLLSAATGKSL